MPKAGTLVPYKVPTDPHQRLVVIRGYATLTSDGTKVLSYDVESLLRAWDEWPGLSVVEFGRHWGIPYQTVTSPKYPFSVTTKRARMMDRQRGWRAAVLSRAVLPETMDEATEIAALRQVLREIHEVGQAGLKYATERMIKTGPDGRRVNMALRPEEVRRFVDIAHKTSQIIAIHVGLREVLKTELGNNDPRARVRPVMNTVARTLPPRIEGKKEQP